MAGTPAILAAELPEPAPRRAAPQAFAGERPEARKGGLTCSGDGRLREGRVPPGGRAERGGRGQGREGDAEGVAGPARRDLATEKPALSIPPRGGRRLTQP